MSTCSSCEHFAAGPLEAIVEPNGDGKPLIGICRRYPPRIVSDRYHESMFPGVHAKHRCGEHAEMNGWMV